MSYAAKLIEMAKEAQGFSSTELAVAMGVKQPTISQWIHGKGSPMSEDRVIELCRLAGIKDYTPWLIGVHAEHLRNREARMSLEKLAKQLGAAAALAVAALLPVGNARGMTQAEPFAELCIMRSIGLQSYCGNPGAWPLPRRISVYAKYWIAVILRQSWRLAASPPDFR